MRIHTSAPGRVSLLGNPSDMYGGSVISCAVNLRAHCTVEPSDKTVFKHLEMTHELENWKALGILPKDFGLLITSMVYAYSHSAKQEFENSLSQHSTLPKMSISFDSEIPRESGMGGSTALILAIVSAFAEREGEQWNPWALAETVGYLEFHQLEIMCGYQDAYMAAFGGLNYMDFRGKENLLHLDSEEVFASIEPLSKYVQELPIIAAFSGVQHNSSTIHTHLRDRWIDDDINVVNAMVEIASLAREGKRALLNSDWETFGELMNENHALIKDISDTGERNELLIKTALENSALGAKLAGAGGGGSIIALTEDPKVTIASLEKIAGVQIVKLDPGALGVQVELG